MTPAEELAIVEPDVDLTVRDPDTGEAAALTVREFRFREGLAAQQIAAPLIAALTALAAAEAEGAAMPEPVEIDAILGENAELWLQLIARACDREADWLGRLGDEDARAVSGAMWTANGQFFFSSRRRARDGEAGAGEPVPLARVLDALAASGHGDHRAIGERMTWRQIELFYFAAEARRAETMAGAVVAGAAASIE